MASDHISQVSVPDEFTTKYFEKDNISLTTTTTGTINIAYDGWEPITFVRWGINNASSSGGGVSYTNVLGLQINNNTLTYRIGAGNGSNSSKVKFDVTILYIKVK